MKRETINSINNREKEVKEKSNEEIKILSNVLMSFTLTFQTQGKNLGNN